MPLVVFACELVQKLLLFTLMLLRLLWLDRLLCRLRSLSWCLRHGSAMDGGRWTAGVLLFSRQFAEFELDEWCTFRPASGAAAANWPASRAFDWLVLRRTFLAACCRCFC